MKKVLVNISNHTLNVKQIAPFDKVIEMPKALKDKWAKIKPDNNVKITKEILDFLRLIVNKEGKYNKIFVHVAGFTPTVRLVVNQMLSKFDDQVCTAIYSFSERNTVEVVDVNGENIKKSVHRYESWNKYKDDTEVEF